MTAQIYDLAGYRQAKAYERAAAEECDQEYADILSGLSEVYRRKALAGAGRQMSEDGLQPALLGG